MESTSSTTIPKIMVFRPTLEEMKDFSKYLEYMESRGAHLGGLAKIIPPPEWIPRKSGYDNINLTIKSPIEQLVTGSQGVYQQFNIQRRSMSFKEFEKLANSPKYCTPEFFDYEDLERKYWKNITYNSPIYGADVPGSLTDKDCKEFNINNLNTILDMINDSYGIKIMGVNTAYLYFGMWKSSFAWHTEDMDLYSINYLHFGAPKSWYCVPPEHGKKLEKIANDNFEPLHQSCPAFLRHKMTLISPQILRKYSIPYNKITQEQGEFMITFPYSYHAGYNHGLNCAESTNFALPRWIEFGKRATVCHCRNDTVKINMDVFVKVFQPERYQNWLEGKDIGPDPKDPTNICAAPSPYELESEYWNRISKAKRQPYKRQLIQNINGTLTFASLEDCCEEEFEDNDNSPDFCYLNDSNFQVKNFKSSRKKMKCNNSAANNLNNSSNGICDKKNPNDGKSNQINKNKNESTKSDIKLLTFDMENFNSNEPITSLDELSRRTLQYTDNPKAFEDEAKLNYYTSLIDPFCSICTILRLFEFNQDLTRVNINIKPPNNSQILLPKTLFLSKLKQSTYVENVINESTLLICTICKLCVHSSCYGINEMVNPQEWKCDRCAVNDFEAACCLCPLRGGALKVTTCNQWAHLTCALVLSHVKIESDVSMKPIDISAVQPFLDSDRTSCCFCSQRSNNGCISNYIIGCCIRCNSNNSCTEYFHVTCAYREGVLFELNDNLTSFKLTCKKCQTIKFNRGKELIQRNMVDIDLEMTVIAKFNSHYYSYAKVIDRYEELFHHVQFVDNTFVNNIRSNDILNRDCEKDRPMIGDPVEVIWNKEQLHGKYAGYHISQMYNVLFDNGSQLALNRGDLYLLNEELPKRVQVKFTDSLKCLE